MAGFETSFGGGGGGFGDDKGFNASQMDSPGGKSIKKTAGCLPVSIKMINEAPIDSPIMFEGKEVELISIVGIIQSLTIETSKMNYIINDGSGCIDATKWVNEISEEDEERLSENTYCRLVGRVKTMQGKRHILLFNIESITDANMITTSILEKIYFQKKMRAIDSLNGGENPGMEGGFTKQTATSHGTNSAQTQGLSSNQILVHQYIQMCNSDRGCSRDLIYSSLKDKLSTRIIDETLDFLSGEGHVYTTIDEDTFKTTDA